RPQMDDEVLIGLKGQESRVFRGEQSNTSIVFGDRVILKLFRKQREGINPEVEIGTFLTRYTSFEAFPKLYGTISLEDGERETTIGALQQFIPSVRDAWSWLTERVTDAALRPSTIEAAATLGSRTGEMHRALASGTDDAFVPEQASGAYATAVRAEAIAELRETVEQLEHRGVENAAALGDALASSLDAFLQIEGTMITRIHGDYHLGQVLRTEDRDFAILDYEGEPTRSLVERRAKASPLRDVAGMLRSLDYAAETARRAGGGERDDLDAWYEDSRDAFLRAYTDTVSSDEFLMRGWNAESRADVLAAFEVHKALYETRYELNNRPDWLEIPLNALQRIAGIGNAR
ncbi:MAG TPA: phosphotransferase, partial [Thermomicrobiales bacterium]|nr:phosphotransferase [Thermomicrobiales bacterium]